MGRRNNLGCPEPSLTTVGGRSLSVGPKERRLGYHVLGPQMVERAEHWRTMGPPDTVLTI